jgi:hypothetical protein
MPVLDRKGSRRSKPIEKPTPEVSFRVWEIVSETNNIHKINQTKQVILTTRQWAFVWCNRHPTGNWYYLYGSIVFQTPHTENWLHANLGNGTYKLPREDPNPFRNREVDLAEDYEEIGWEVIMLIDEKHF